MTRDRYESRWAQGLRAGALGTVLLAGAILLVAAAGAARGVDYDLSWYTIDGGGGHSSGGSYELDGTIGQPDAGVMAGGDYVLTGGFWGGATVVVLQIVTAGREGTVGHDAFVMFEVSPPVAGATYELEAASSPSGPWSKRADAVLTGANGEYMFSLELDPGATLIFFRVKQVP